MRYGLSLALVLMMCGCDPGPGSNPEADVAVPDADHDDAVVGFDAELDATGNDGARPTPDGAPADGAVDRDAQTPGDGSAVDGAPADATPLDPDTTPPQGDAGPGDPPARATPLVTEFMARNESTLEDEDGDTPDWIEIYNPGDAPYDLDGHHLTDDLDDTTKWRFPAVELPARSYMVIFASDKERADPEGPLHTNFKLAGDGESVALTDPDGVVLHALAEWPGQVDGVAYGLPMRIGRTPLLASGGPATLWVGGDPEGAELPGFDDRRWIPVEQGAGVDDRPPERAALADVGDLLRTDLSPYLGAADAFWLRVPFDIPDGVGPVELELTYDDGVTAWVDGEVVYRDNHIVGAAIDRPDSRSTGPVRIGLGERGAGPGMLVLRAVDSVIDDGFFFAHAGISARGLVIEERAGYLAIPTPGADNIIGAEGLGPIVVDLDRHQPLAAGEVLPIGASILPTDAPIDGVTITVRRMFEPPVRFEMELIGDRWQFELPADFAEPGQMIRWFVEARDTVGRTTRHPPFLDPTDSAEYYGTMVADPIETNLPVYHWFVEDLAAAGTEAGTRGALFHGGELYDNIEIDLHGQATTRFPKKSYNFDFNRDHRFRVRDDLERVKDFDLLTNYADKAKMRNTISYGMFRDAGHAYHLVFPVRVQRNGEFFAVYEFVEDPDERWLRRMGYEEPFGAVYKCYDTLSSVNGSEKKTREDEGTDDLAALIQGLSQPSFAARRTFAYDNVDMAGMANFLAMLVVTSGRDCCTKNYYAYHDLQTDLWWYLPWDIDLTLGRNWTGSYFDDRMFPENPLYEGRENRLIGLLYDLPEFLEMYHRRLRTLYDEQMQPLNTPYEERYLENEADRLLALIGPDGELDNAAWGTWGEEQTQAEAVRIMKEDWIIPRRQFIYSQLVQRAGGPVQTLLRGAPGAATARYFIPTDDDLGDAWTAPDFDDDGWDEGPLGIGYENADAEYAPLIETEVRPQDRDPAATTTLLRVRFDVDEPVDEGLTLRMKYDDGYVAWINGVEVARRNVGNGELTWRSEAGVHDDGLAVRFEDRDISAFIDVLRPRGNVLAIRAVNAGANSSDMLIQPEIIDGLPASDGPLPPAQPDAPDVVIVAAEEAGDQSYVVIANREQTAIDLSGWRLEGRGIEHDLRGGTVIPADSLLYVVADVPRFREREDGPRGGQGLFIQGNWRGALAGAGEMSLAPGGE